MNGAHFHLMLNHVPVLGVVFGLGLLLFALVRNQEAVLRVGLAVLLLSAISAVPVFLSGEPAENVVEHSVGINKAAIETHEEMAGIALAGIEILGVLSAALLLNKPHKVGRGGQVGVAIVALIVSLLMGWTAYLGGQVHHGEIGAPPAATQPAND